jgi:hypothetical protein
MLSGLLDPSAQMPRNRLFWAVLGALIFGQLMALWLLCSHQVRKAEARQTEVQVQQLALADCLQYIPGATIATCTSRIAASGIGSQGNSAATMGAARAPAAGVMPVVFTR